MGVRLDVTGERYGRLTAIEFVATAGRASVWRFRCDCGEVVDRRLGNVRSRQTKSCGCLDMEPHHVTHGHAPGGKRSPELRVWQHMISRTTNVKDPAWGNYGGRGVGVCERWRSSFVSFLADMGPRPSGLTLERVDNDLGYMCGMCHDCAQRGIVKCNCEWATRTAQARNRRTAKLTEADVADIKARLRAGESGASIARLHGVGATMIHSIKIGKAWKDVAYPNERTGRIVASSADSPDHPLTIGALT